MTWTITPRGYKTIVDMGAPNSAEFVGPNHAANAQLSAAAPGLLAALTKLVANWDANHTPSALDDLSPPNLDIEAARAEIAKAKGA